MIKPKICSEKKGCAFNLKYIKPIIIARNNFLWSISIRQRQTFTYWTSAFLIVLGMIFLPFEAPRCLISSLVQNVIYIYILHFPFLSWNLSCMWSFWISYVCGVPICTVIKFHYFLSLVCVMLIWLLDQVEELRKTEKSFFPMPKSREEGVPSPWA